MLAFPSLIPTRRTKAPGSDSGVAQAVAAEPTPAASAPSTAAAPAASVGASASATPPVPSSTGGACVCVCGSVGLWETAGSGLAGRIKSSPCLFASYPFSSSRLLTSQDTCRSRCFWSSFCFCYCLSVRGFARFPVGLTLPVSISSIYTGSVVPNKSLSSAWDSTPPPTPPRVQHNDPAVANLTLLFFLPFFLPIRPFAGSAPVELAKQARSPVQPRTTIAVLLLLLPLRQLLLHPPGKADTRAEDVTGTTTATATAAATCPMTVSAASVKVGTGSHGPIKATKCCSQGS